MSKEIAAEIDKAFEWFTLLLTVLTGALLTVLTWMMDRSNVMEVRFTIGITLSLVLPLILLACSWIMGLLHMNPTMRTRWRLFSWSIASIVFIYCIQLFVAIGGAVLTKGSLPDSVGLLLVKIAVVTISILVPILFPWGFILRRYRASTLEDPIWESKIKILGSYIFGVILSGFLILVPLILF